MKDDLNGGTISLDRRTSSFPSKIPAADAQAQLDPSDLDPLDSCETIPVPRAPGSIKPVDVVPSSPPLASAEDAPVAAPVPVASDPEPAGPPPVEESKESQAPKEESRATEAADESKARVAFDRAPETELPDEKPPAELHEAATSSSNVAVGDTSDATSTSAQVLPVAADPSDGPEESAIASERAAPATRESVPLRQITGSRWLVPAAVAMVVGLWWLPRTTPEQAKPHDAPARVAPPTTAGDPVSGGKPAPSSEVVAGTIVGSRTESPAQTLTEKRDQPRDDREPARLSAYKAAASAGRKVTKCRYAGDSPGVVRVVVTFDPSGHVRRTRVQGNLANPMTLRCITSQFNELTIPAFSGDATSVATDVKIY